MKISNAKHPGMGLILTLLVISVIVLITLSGVIFTKTLVEVQESRTETLQSAVYEVTETVLRQAAFYGGLRGDFYGAQTQSEKDALKSRALGNWFEGGNSYSYQEMKSRFGASKFEAADKKLQLSSLRLESITITMPEDIRREEVETYQIDPFGRFENMGVTNQDVSSIGRDENGFITACTVVIEMKFEDGFRIYPLLRQRKRITGNSSPQRKFDISWRYEGATVTIPVKMTGGGIRGYENFQ